VLLEIQGGVDKKRIEELIKEANEISNIPASQ
jgi:hypothetical protein